MSGLLNYASPIPMPKGAAGKHGPARRLVQAFADSGQPSAEVDWRSVGYNSVQAARSGLHTLGRTVGGVRVTARDMCSDNPRVWLVLIEED